MTNPTRLYSLITGASSGIGKALAFECAKRGRNLILVSLPGEDLPAIAAEIAAVHDVDVRYRETDLSLPDAAQEMYDWCKAEGHGVNLLANNAGFGTLSRFENTDIEKESAMRRLNMDTPFMLMRLFLPEMLKMEAAWILNVSSQAAFFPIPFKITYAATKTFLMWVSIALSYELKETNVKVTCVCPSGVKTNKEIRSRIETAGYWSRISAMEADEVAVIAMNGLEKGKRRIVPGFINKVVFFLSRVLPKDASMYMAAKRFGRGL